MSCCGITKESCNVWHLLSHSTLPEPHVKEVQRIHHVLQSWLLAKNEEREEVKATAALLAINVDPAYAFSPSPVQPYRAVLLSITQCYWLATSHVLSPASRLELADRIKPLPSFGSTTPLFKGDEVDSPREVNEAKLEGLMRIVGAVLVGLAGDDVVKMWQELADVGGRTWESE